MNMTAEMANEVLTLSQESRSLHRNLRRWWGANDAQRENFLAHAAVDPAQAKQQLQFMAQTQDNLKNMSLEQIDSQLRTIRNFRTKLLSSAVPM